MNDKHKDINPNLEEVIELVFEEDEHDTYTQSLYDRDCTDRDLADFAYSVSAGELA